MVLVHHPNKLTYNRHHHQYLSFLAKLKMTHLASLTPATNPRINCIKLDPHHLLSPIRLASYSHLGTDVCIVMDHLSEMKAYITVQPTFIRAS